ncbi:unnamed protein product [Phaeothamnion confervicola]
MKLKNLRTISFAALCATCLISTGSYAWAGGGGGPDGPYTRELFSAERLASKLELSDTQRSAVEQLMDESRKQARPFVRQLMDQRKAMRALSASESFDEAAVRAQAAQGATLLTELVVLHARNDYELRKLLTPAQREKMQDMHGRHRGR